MRAKLKRNWKSLSEGQTYKVLDFSAMSYHGRSVSAVLIQYPSKDNKKKVIKVPYEMVELVPDIEEPKK